jgi:type IV secretory pathway VirB6-like protein
MNKILYLTHKLFLTFLLLILASCQGFFQILTSTPQCIAAVDFGDIVSVKINLKVNPNEYGEKAFTPPGRLCQNAADGIDGYQVTYYNTGVEYTSVNNPLTIKAFGYGDFCSKSFATGYETSTSAGCNGVDCSADPGSSCCTMAIQEDASECQTSAIMLNPKIQGKQPTFSDNELICSDTPAGNTSYQFDATDNFLVLVPKVCIPGDHDSNKNCSNNISDYKDIKKSGVWQDCSKCTSSTNNSDCNSCGCVLKDYVCDTSGGASNVNGACTCGNKSNCEVKYTEVIGYYPDQIDFAKETFQYDTTDGFVTNGSNGDGVCSKFEFMVMQSYYNLEKMNSVDPDINLSAQEMQKNALSSVSLGFIIDAADNNTSSNIKYYQQIYSTEYGGSKTKQVFLNQNCSATECNLATYTYDAVNAKLSNPTGTTTYQCSGSVSDYTDFVEGCSNQRHAYNNCLKVGYGGAECFKYHENLTLDTCIDECKNFVDLGYVDANDCFEQESLKSESTCYGFKYQSFQECVSQDSNCENYNQDREVDGSTTSSCESLCDAASKSAYALAGQYYYNEYYKCIIGDTSHCLSNYNMCKDAGNTGCDTEYNQCNIDTNKVACKPICTSSEEDAYYTEVKSSCCGNSSSSTCVNDKTYWNTTSERIYLYDPEMEDGAKSIKFSVGDKSFYLSDTDTFTLLDGSSAETCECLFDSSIDCDEDNICYDISVSDISINDFYMLHYDGVALNGWGRLEYVRPYVENNSCDGVGGDYKSSRPFYPWWLVFWDHAYDHHSVDEDYNRGCWQRKRDISYGPFKCCKVIWYSAWEWKGKHYVYNNISNNIGQTSLMIRTLETCSGGSELIRIKIGEGDVEDEMTLKTLANLSASHNLTKTGQIYARVVDSFANEEGDCFVTDQAAYDYAMKNNAGTFLLSITTIEDEIELTSIVPLIIEPFNYLFQSDFKESAFNNIVGSDSLFQTLLKIVVTLYISYMGLMFVVGLSQISQGELLKRLIRIGIVYMFVSPGGWEFFYTYIIQFFEGGAEDLAELFTYSLRPDLEDSDDGALGSFVVFDYFFYYLFQQVILTKLVAILFSPILVGWLLFAFVVGAVICVIVAIGKIIILYVMAKVVLTILFIIGPIFFIFLVFESTKQFFRNWLNMIISYSIQLAMIFFVVNIFGYMILAALFDVFSFGVCWGTILSINFPFMPPFEMLSFWRAAGIDPRYSAEYNAAQTVSFYSTAYFFALGYFFMKFTDSVIKVADTIAGGGASGATLGDIAGKLTSQVAPMMRKAATKAGKVGLRAGAFGGKLAYKTAAPIARQAISAAKSAGSAGLKTGALMAAGGVKFAGHTIGSTVRAAGSGAKTFGYTAAGVGRFVKGDVKKAKENFGLAQKKFTNTFTKHGLAGLAKSTYKDATSKDGLLNKAAKTAKDGALKTGGHLARAGVSVLSAPKRLGKNIAESWQESKTKNLRKEFGEATGLISNKEAERRREQRRRFEKGVKDKIKEIKELNLSDAEKMDKLRKDLREKFKGDEKKVDNYIRRNERNLIWPSLSKQMTMKGESHSEISGMGRHIRSAKSLGYSTRASYAKKELKFIKGVDRLGAGFSKGMDFLTAPVRKTAGLVGGKKLEDKLSFEKNWRKHYDGVIKRREDHIDNLVDKSLKIRKNTEFDKYSKDIESIRTNLDERYGKENRDSEVYKKALESKMQERLADFKTDGNAMMIYHKEMEEKKLDLIKDGKDEAAIRAELITHSNTIKEKIADNLKDKGIVDTSRLNPYEDETIRAANIHMAKTKQWDSSYTATSQFSAQIKREVDEYDKQARKLGKDIELLEREKTTLEEETRGKLSELDLKIKANEDLLSSVEPGNKLRKEILEATIEAHKTDREATQSRLTQKQEEIDNTIEKTTARKTAIEEAKKEAMETTAESLTLDAKGKQITANLGFDDETQRTSDEISKTKLTQNVVDSEIFLKQVDAYEKSQGLVDLKGSDSAILDKKSISNTDLASGKGPDPDSGPDKSSIEPKLGSKDVGLDDGGSSSFKGKGDGGDGDDGPGPDLPRKPDDKAADMMLASEKQAIENLRKELVDEKAQLDQQQEDLKQIEALQKDLADKQQKSDALDKEIGDTRTQIDQADAKVAADFKESRDALEKATDTNLEASQQLEKDKADLLDKQKQLNEDIALSQAAEMFEKHEQEYDKQQNLDQQAKLQEEKSTVESDKVRSDAEYEENQKEIAKANMDNVLDELKTKAEDKEQVEKLSKEQVELDLAKQQSEELKDQIEEDKQTLEDSKKQLQEVLDNIGQEQKQASDKEQSRIIEQEKQLRQDDEDAALAQAAAMFSEAERDAASKDYDQLLDKAKISDAEAELLNDSQAKSAERKEKIGNDLEKLEADNQSLTEVEQKDLELKQSQINAEEKRIEAVREEQDALNKQIESEKAELKQSQDKSLELDQKITEDKLELEAAQTQYEQSEKDQELINQRNAMLAEIEQTGIDKQVQISEKAQEELNDLKSEAQANQDQLEIETKNLAKLESEKVALDKELEGFEQEEARIKEEQVRLAQRQDESALENDRLTQEETQKLADDKAILEDEQAKLVKLREENEALETQIQKDSDALSEGQARQEELASEQTSRAEALAEQQKAHDTASSELAKLTEFNAEQLQQEQEAIDKQVQISEKAQAELNDLKSEAQANQEQLEIETTRLAELESEKAMLDAKVEGFKQDEARIHEEQVILEHSKIAAESENDRLTKEETQKLADDKAILEAEQAELVSLKEANKVLEDQIQKDSDALSEGQARQEALALEQTSRAEALAAQQEAQAKASSELDELTKSNAEQLQKEQAAIDIKQQELEAAQVQIEKLAIDASNNDEAISKVQSELDQLTKQQENFDKVQLEIAEQQKQYFEKVQEIIDEHGQGGMRSTYDTVAGFVGTEKTYHAQIKEQVDLAVELSKDQDITDFSDNIDKVNKLLSDMSEKQSFIDISQNKELFDKINEQAEGYQTYLKEHNVAEHTKAKTQNEEQLREANDQKSALDDVAKVLSKEKEQQESIRQSADQESTRLREEKSQHDESRRMAEEEASQRLAEENTRLEVSKEALKQTSEALDSTIKSNENLTSKLEEDRLTSFGQEGDIKNMQQAYDKHEAANRQSSIDYAKDQQAREAELEAIAKDIEQREKELETTAKKIETAQSQSAQHAEEVSTSKALQEEYKQKSQELQTQTDARDSDKRAADEESARLREEKSQHDESRRMAEEEASQRLVEENKRLEASQAAFTKTSEALDSTIESNANLTSKLEEERLTSFGQEGDIKNMQQAYDDHEAANRQSSIDYAKDQQEREAKLEEIAKNIEQKEKELETTADKINATRESSELKDIEIDTSRESKESYESKSQELSDKSASVSQTKASADEESTRLREEKSQHDESRRMAEEEASQRLAEEKTRLEANKIEIDKASEELMTQNAQNEALSKQIDKDDLQAVFAQDAINRDAEQLEVKQSEMAEESIRIDNERSERAARIEEQKAELEMREAEYAEIKQQSDAANAKLEDDQRRLSEQKEQLDSLEQDLAMAQKERENAIDRQESSEEELESLRTEHEEKERIREETKQQVETALREESGIDETAAKIAQEQEALERQNMENAEREQKLQEQSQELSDRAEQIAKHNEEILAREEELKVQQEELALQKSVDDKLSQEKQEALEAQIQANQEALKENEKALEDAQAQKEYDIALENLKQQELDAAAQRIKEQEDFIAKQADDLEKQQLDQSLEEVFAVNERKVALEETIEIANQEKGLVADEILATQSKIDELTSRQDSDPSQSKSRQERLQEQYEELKRMEEVYESHQQMVEEYRASRKEGGVIADKQEVNEMITSQVSNVAESRREQMRQEALDEKNLDSSQSKSEAGSLDSSAASFEKSSADLSSAQEPSIANTAAIELRNARQAKRTLETQLANEKVREPKNQRRIEELEKEIETIANRIAMLEARVG